MSAVVAMVQIGAEDEIVAVRFPHIDAVHAWEDMNPGVYVVSTCRLVTKAEAKAGS